MGFFEFVKSAGEALGIVKGEPDAESIKKAVDAHQLGADKIDVKVEGDKAVLSGVAATQEALEKIILTVGNTLGIGKVESNVSAPDAKEPVFYTVKKGDTLSAIAKATLGNASKYPAIFEANKPMLKHPDKIYPGQVLRIPKE
jgi:nucleoid-associated protein YgaU